MNTGKYVLTNARMIADGNMLACDIACAATGQAAAYVFIGKYLKEASALRHDDSSVYASRVYAGARALRYLQRSDAWKAFVVNGVIDPAKRVALPNVIKN